MNFLNLLAQSQNFIDFAVEGIASNKLNWIGNLIKWLFDLFQGVPGGVAIGAILFTVCLKTIVLPLDAYSRVKTKKQSLLMERMRPQMEKLQKQYQGDKTMYSQKVMELQKANGYNPLGACLPMIVSLVIFMIVFSAFSTYSNYAMLDIYNNMVNAYNGSVETYVYATYDEEEAKTLLGEGVAPESITLEINGEESVYYVINSDNFLIKVSTPSVETGNESASVFKKEVSYIVDYDKFETAFNAYYEQESAKNPGDDDTAFAELKAKKALFENGKANEDGYADMNEAVVYYVQLNARAASAQWYRDNKSYTSFGWVGNMWYPDSMLNKEMPNFSKFSSSISRAVGSGMTSAYEESYNEVVFNLNLPDPAYPTRKPELQKYNGYFVLVVLSIGVMFLQQFITMRSQKAANELSSVDGTAARTNKWMTILMPIIFGVFAFFYSAAFSLYMITNNLYSFVTTVIINKIVSVRFAKKELVQGSIKGKRQANRKRLK